MVIETKKTIFYHFPKCGGTFVKRILKESCKEYKQIAPSHSLPEIETDKLKFTFLRDPISWYVSYYCARRSACKASLVSDYSKNFDESLYRTFSEFVEEVTRKQHGFLSKLYREYSKTCDLVGRFEMLRFNLIEILNKAGEKCDENKIENYPRENMAGWDVIVSEEDKLLIEHSEHEAFKIWSGDYDTKK